MREPAEHRGSMSSPDPSKVLPVKESNRATVPQVTLLRDIAAIILAMFAGVLTYASTFLWCGGVLFVLGRLKDHRDLNWVTTVCSLLACIAFIRQIRRTYQSLMPFRPMHPPGTPTANGSHR